MNQISRTRGVMRQRTNRLRIIPIRLLALVASLSIAQAEPPSDNSSKRASQEPTILGFSNGSATQERTLEKQFDSQLKRENLDAWMKRMSARPHHVGSAFDKD